MCTHEHQNVNSISSQIDEEDSHCTPQPAIGDVDADVIVMEMTLYDDYRKLDGNFYSKNYLFKCRKTLMTRVKEYKKRIHELEKEVERAKLDGKEENERIRDFYEVIALGKSRTGKIVRSAMGTSLNAEKIINSLERIFSADSNLDT